MPPPPTPPPTHLWIKGAVLPESVAINQHCLGGAGEHPLASVGRDLTRVQGPEGAQGGWGMSLRS